MCIKQIKAKNKKTLTDETTGIWLVRGTLAPERGERMALWWTLIRRRWHWGASGQW